MKKNLRINVRTLLLMTSLLMPSFASAQEYGLDFPGTESAESSISFQFVDPHLNGLPMWGPEGRGVTYIWKAFPRNQSGYFTTFFWGNAGNFFWGGQGLNNHYGAHPFPTTDGRHRWEISAGGDTDGQNFIGDYVEYERWYTQVLRVWEDEDGKKQHQFYYDWDSQDSEKVATYTSVGDCGSSNEIYNGVIRGIQIYNNTLSLDDIQNEIDSPKSTTAGEESVWYLNINPRANDLADRSGNGNNPTWVSDARPDDYWDGVVAPTPIPAPPQIPQNVKFEKQ